MNNSMLFFFPGPKYYFNEIFGERFNALSKNFSGVIFTSGDSVQSGIMLGNFELISIRYDHKFKIKYYLYYFINAFKIARKLKKQGVDLVVSYDPLMTGLVAFFVSYYMNSKLVIEVNGDVAHPAIYMGYKNQLYKRAKRTFFKCIARFVLKRADGIRLLYETQIDWVKNKINRQQKIISVYSDYVNITPFIDCNKNIKEENIILLIGFPFYIKGIDILINAFQNICQSVPEWHLHLLGWYPNRQIILNLIGSTPRIEVLDAVPHKDMPKYIARSKIIVQPSRTEAMGRALVEAAAAGKARIASNTGGIPTVVTHNQTGILVEPENIEELQNALLLLIYNEELRAKLGRQAKVEAVQKHSINTYTKNMEIFYKSVINQ